MDVRTGHAGDRHPARPCAQIGDETIAVETVVWAAGVAASPLGATLGAPVDRAGRVLVNPDLTVPGHADVFVIGDLASLKGADGKPLPGVSRRWRSRWAVMQRATSRPRIRGRPGTPFRYRDLGNMATIGRASAVADFGWLRLKGLIAWQAWLFVHIMNLIGFRNRLVVLVQWAWAYFSYQRAVRLITGSDGMKSQR